MEPLPPLCIYCVFPTKRNIVFVAFFWWLLSFFPASGNRSVVLDTKNPLFCSSRTARGIIWSDTELGQIQRQPCPENSTGVASWMCDENGQFSGELPNLSECRVLNISGLVVFSQTRSETSDRNATDELVTALRNREFRGGDIQDSVSAIGVILDYWKDVSFQWSLNHVSIMKSIINCVDTLLSPNNSDSWMDLPMLYRKSLGSQIFTAIRDVGLSLSEYGSPSKPDNFDFIELHFQLLNDTKVTLNTTHATLLANLSNIRFTAPFEIMCAIVLKSPIIDPIFTNFSSDINLYQFRTISHVVGVGISLHKKPILHEEPFHVALKTREPIENLSETICGVLDSETLSWSTNLCVRVDELSSLKEIRCLCNSSGYFAILINASKEDSTIDWTSTSTTTLSTCNGRLERDIYWPKTDTNTAQMQKCPGKSEGNATWRCNSTTGNFDADGPDLSDCRNLTIRRLDQKLDGGALARDIVDNLTAILKESDGYRGGDIIDAISLLSKSIDAELKQNSNRSKGEERQKIVESFSNLTITSSDILLSRDRIDVWKDLNMTFRVQMLSLLLDTNDKLGFKMMTILPDDTFFQTSSFEIEVRRTSAKFLIYPNTSVKTSSSIQIYLPTHSSLIVVFTRYSTVNHIFTSHSETNGSQRLISDVIGASLNFTSMKDLDIEVIITLKNYVRLPDGNISICVFWNRYKYSWDTSGCVRNDSLSNSTHTVCKCNHLTHFGVLMNYLDIPAREEKPLKWITLFGCIISILCLAACITIFLLVRKLRNFQYRVHINLCISLMFADILLVVGVFYDQDDDEVQTGCRVLAIFLLFFFLASLTWMSLEAVQIYLHFVVILNTARTRKHLYYIAGYGIPILIVGISSTVYSEGFGTANSCWLDTKSGFIWMFISFVAIAVSVNYVILVLVIRSIHRTTRPFSMTSSIRSWLWQLTVLQPLLGLTWIFGLIQVKETAASSYIFTILNSLQGFLIFTFHCALNNHVQEYFKKKWSDLNLFKCYEVPVVIKSRWIFQRTLGDGADILHEEAAES